MGLALVVLTLVSPHHTPAQINNSEVTTNEVVTEVQTPEVPASEPVATPVEEIVQEAAPLPSGDCSLVNNYDWPRDIARGICLAESGGNPNAVNWGDNHGKCVGSFSLMQVGCFWYPYFGYSEADFYNPIVNMDIAYKIWQRQGGFGAWTTYTRGLYQRHL